MAPRILIVEDNPDLARALVRFLSRSGYDVTHAESCAEAKAVNAVFDVAILDVELRDGYGYDLHEYLLGTRSVRSAIFFTGTIDPVLLDRAESLAPCIPKCEGIEALLKALHAALARLPRQAAGGEETPLPSSPRNRPRR